MAIAGLNLNRVNFGIPNRTPSPLGGPKIGVTEIGAPEVGVATSSGTCAVAAGLTVSLNNDGVGNARQALDIANSARFDTLRETLNRSAGVSPTENAVSLLTSLTDVSSTDAASPAALTATLDKVDAALRATDAPKDASAMQRSPSPAQSGLLSTTFSSGDGTADAASLLIQAVAGYGHVAPPIKSGSATAIGVGVLRVNSLV